MDRLRKSSLAVQAQLVPHDAELRPRFTSTTSSLYQRHGYRTSRRNDTEEDDDWEVKFHEQDLIIHTGALQGRASWCLVHH